MFFAQGDIWNGLDFNTVLLRFTALAVWVLTVLKIVAFFKRTPSIDKEFATKSEVAAALTSLTESGEVRRHEIEGKIEALRLQVEKKMDSIQKKLEAAADKESVQMQSIQRELGKISGRLETIPPH